MVKRIRVKVSKLPDDVYQEALTQGFKVMLNQQHTKEALIDEIYDMARRYVRQELNVTWPVSSYSIDKAAMAFIKGKIKEMD